MFKIKHVKCEIKDDFPTGYGGLRKSFKTRENNLSKKLNCQLGLFSKDEFFRRVRNSPNLYKVSISVTNQRCGLIDYSCVLIIKGIESQVDDCISYIKRMLY